MVQMPIAPDQRQVVGNAGDKMEGPTWDAANDHIAYNLLAGTPWHEMGTGVHGLVTAEEAIVAGKLDWEVVTKPVGVRMERTFLTDQRMQAVMRADATDLTGVFAYTSKAYQPLQNREAFSFFDTVVGEGQAIYEVVGYIDGGRKVWLLVQLPQHTFEPVKGDVVQDYMLLMNSHDASSSVRGGHTPIRVVCRNTLNRALNKIRSDAFNFRTNHIGDVSGRVQQAARLMAAQEGAFARWKDEVTAMVNTRFAAADAEQFVLDLVQAERIVNNPGYEAASSIEELHAVQRPIAERLTELVEAGSGTDIRGVRGTGWGLYNAATEFADHFALAEPRGRKSERPMADRQLDYLLMGNGAKLKERARQWVLEGRDAVLAN